jgi:mannose-6-phosphate isomerase-like protein (cupin superfamily)
VSRVTRAGTGPFLSYAGQPMQILAGDGGDPAGFAAMEMTIPPRFAGPIPHAHDEFDEALYVLSGRLLVVGDGAEESVEPGGMFVAPRGERHGFRNPDPDPVRVLGIWSPAQKGLALMRDIGAVLSATGPPDPEAMREVYDRHASRLLPDS